MMDNRHMEKFLALYRTLTVDNLELLQEVYREDIRFIDPAHEIRGLDELRAYFHCLYKDLQSIDFHFSPPLIVENSGSVRWRMTFSHKGLAKGKPLSLEGISYIEFDGEGKVFFHRDYFDLGAMLYEHVPLLGRLVLFIKKRLGQ